MILFRLAKENSLRSFNLFLLLCLSIICINGNEIKYSVNYGKYNGILTVDYYNTNDTVNIDYNTSIGWGIVRIKNNCALLLDLLKPLYINTSFNSFFRNYTGSAVFSDTIALYRQSKDSMFKYSDKQINDWLLLPYFFLHYNDSIYDCTLLQGDYLFRKTVNGNTIIWEDKKQGVSIIIEDSIPILIKATNMKIKKI